MACETAGCAAYQGGAETALAVGTDGGVGIVGVAAVFVCLGSVRRLLLSLAISSLLSAICGLFGAIGCLLLLAVGWLGGIRWLALLAVAGLRGILTLWCVTALLLLMLRRRSAVAWLRGVLVLGSSAVGGLRWVLALVAAVIVVA
jgi:hypothetical protein